MVPVIIGDEDSLAFAQLELLTRCAFSRGAALCMSQMKPIGETWRLAADLLRSQRHLAPVNHLPAFTTHMESDELPRRSQTNSALKRAIVQRNNDDLNLEPYAIYHGRQIQRYPRVI
jgi:hypothetical protein